MKRDRTLQINTRFNADMIEQSLEWSDEDYMPLPDLNRKVVALCEQGVRDALIALGWTPPPQPNYALENLRFEPCDEGRNLRMWIGNQGFTIYGGSETRWMEQQLRVALATLVSASRGRDENARRVIGYLRSIEKIAGNLPDDRLESCNGPNDAAMRGLWVCAARDIAQAALRALGEPTENFNAQD